MSLWILDTDHITLVQNFHPVVTEKFNQTPPQKIAVTIVSLEEQSRGWLNMINQCQGEKLIWAYQGLHNVSEFFNSLKILDFDQKAHSWYLELVKERVRIGTKDLRIAAITLSQNAILVTRNRRDFEKVPGLKFEDWSI
jgi:tRNA(fMet)-specific endonuclease VapC